MLKTKDILKLERIKRGWKQEDVAQLLNISRGAYSQYETGSITPTTDNILKLAELFNVTTDYLLCYSLKSHLKGAFNSGKSQGENIIEDVLKTKRVRTKKQN